MRYRRVSYRYTMVLGSSPSWSFGEPWQNERVRLLVPIRWRPDADTYETATTVQIVVDLAGVDEEDFEVQLFDDVMRGNRLLALVTQRHPQAEPAGPDDLYRVGTVAVIHQLARVPDGSV